MTKWHAKDNGEPGRCNAQEGKCPKGKDTPHFNTKDEVRKAVEENYKEFMIPPGRKKERQEIRKKKIKKFVTVGGVLASTVNIAACGPSPMSNDTNSNNDTSNTNNTTQDTTQHTQDGLQQAIDKGNEKLNKVKEKSKGLRDALDKYTSSSSNSNNSASSSTDSNNIYFQGRSLKPSGNDIEEAKQALSQLKVMEDGDYLDRQIHIDYNRERDYGKGFKSGVVGKMEHRDVTNGEFKSSSPKSRAVGGNFIDPYTGNTVDIVKGSKTDTDVDHVIPLKAASVLGGDDWNSDSNKKMRKQLANDPDNLVITSSAANRSKGDRMPNEWTPSYEPAQCSYIIQQIKVLKKYDLSINHGAKNVMTTVLNSKCSE